MDQNKAPLSQPDEQNLFKLDNVVTSDEVTHENTATPTPQTDATAAENIPAPPVTQPNNITWTASEFIAHYKSFGWYFLLTLGALILGTFVWWLTKDKFSSVLVVIGVLLLGIYSSHKPRELTYSLDNSGLTINDRHHLFSEFRSFSVVSEGAFSSIELTPLKRFAMYTTVYFDPADEDKIVAVMSDHMPIEEPRNDPIDQLMHLLRF